MKIAVNMQTLVKDQLEGLGWFTYESFKRIVQQHPEHDFLFIFGKGIYTDFIFGHNVKAINVGPPFFRPLAWFIKFQFLIPAIIKKHQIDLYISSDGFSSTKLKVKNLIVIHDLNFEEKPEWLPKNFSNYYRKYFPKWAKKATRIASVSEYSKQDINKRYHIQLNKIDVVYNGSNDVYKPIPVQEKERTKEKYTLGNDYFVFIGNIHPRKNLNNLLAAFDLFKKIENTSIKLVVIGNTSYWDSLIKETYRKMQFKDDVIFLGHLQIEQLHTILASSIALCYPSIFEGFGIPILEAMSCETAVITSNITSMPEIAGDAALFVDPFSIRSIADAMTTIFENPHLRQELIEKGRIQKEKFSWDKTANKLWKSIEKVIHE